jgi:hypothetical protein
LKLFHTNRSGNPGIEELRQSDDFELFAELPHDQIKDFIRNNITEESRIIRIYMVYQVIMILTGIFFLSRSVVLVIRGDPKPFLFVLGSLVFTLTLLVIIHELLHGLALKIAGAKKIKFGGYFKKFIFYAEADRFVMNRRQFAFVALTPFTVIKILTLAGIILFFNQPILYFPVIIMSAHSLFCAGDIVILSFFFRYPGLEVFTYDSAVERKSYFFRTTSPVRDH